MEVIIKKREFRTEVIEVKVNLPENPIYWFKFGVRTSGCVIPIFTTWNEESYNKPEEIFEYKCVFVDALSFGCGKIEVFKISVSDLTQIYSGNDSMRKDFCEVILNGVEDREIRTEQQFLNDLDSVVNETNKRS